MTKTNKEDNVISMSVGFTGDIPTVGTVQILPPTPKKSSFIKALIV